MTPNLPGLPTMVGLMLVALLATWLSVAGPPNLKEWQPLLAACIALIGGAMAYKGAIAKVAFDREVHAKEVRRRTIGLLLKLDFASRLFSGDAKRTWMWMDIGFRDGQRDLIVADFCVSRPREFEEAWDNLDIVPSGVVFDLANIKTCLGTLDAVVSNFKPDQMWKIDYLHIPAEVVGVIKLYQDLEKSADAITAALQEEISALRQ